MMPENSFSPPKIKICGLTRLQDVELAIELGAWAVGFIFYPKSPRYISPEKVGQLFLEIGAFSKSPLKNKISGLKRVGVFVNPTLAELRDAVTKASLSVIQLHGDESDPFIQEVRNEFPHLEIFQAFRIAEGRRVSAASDYQLVDSMSQNSYGGTGIPVDWGKAAEIQGLPLILAGGLTPENVGIAVAQVQAFAIDVSSGIELSPGVKSEEKMRAFFKAVQTASLSTGVSDVAKKF